MPPDDSIEPTPSPAGWAERCIDCLPFKQLDLRVDRLEMRASRIDDRLHEVEKTQTLHTSSLAELKKSVDEVAGWLLGNGKGTGFKVEWALLSAKLERGISIRERLAWMVGGAIMLSLLAFAGSLAIDAIQRGISP